MAVDIELNGSPLLEGALPKVARPADFVLRGAAAIFRLGIADSILGTRCGLEEGAGPFGVLGNGGPVFGSEQIIAAIGDPGGWRTRPTFRRPAYDSSAMRKLRLRLAELHHLQKLTRLCSGAAAGCWPQALVVCCSKLRQKGVALPMGSIGTLRSAALSHLKLVKAEISQLGSEMRRARHHRWKENLPSL